MTRPSPSTRRRQQRVARLAKRAPGYQLLLTEVLPRVRRNPVLSDLAWRVFAPKHGAGHVDVPLLGGADLTGSDVRMLPVVGVVALDADEPGVSRLLDQLAALQRQHRSFRPLLVTDVPAFGAARTHGYVLEHLLPRRSWQGDQEGYDGYVAERLAGLVDHYQLWMLLHAEESGLLTGRDVGILAALSTRLPAELDVRATPAPAPPETHRSDPPQEGPS